MPKISTISINLAGRDLSALNAELSNATSVPPDDLPLISNLAEATNLLRHHSGQGFNCFRIADFPSVTIAWKPAGTAAMVFILHRRRLRTAVLVLLGKNEQDDAMALSVIRASLDLTATEEAKLKSQPGPLLAFFDVSSLPLEVAHLIGVLMIVPALCELHGVE
jgi:hypothetical protein